MKKTVLVVGGEHSNFKQLLQHEMLKGTQVKIECSDNEYKNLLGELFNNINDKK